MLLANCSPREQTVHGNLKAWRQQSLRELLSQNVCPVPTMGTFQNCSLLFINRWHGFSESRWQPDSMHWCQDCEDSWSKDPSANESEYVLSKIFVNARKVLLFFFYLSQNIFTQGCLNVLLNSVLCNWLWRRNWVAGFQMPHLTNSVSNESYITDFVSSSVAIGI